MSTILKKRNIQREEISRWIPLWKLKLTSEEFRNLAGHIRNEFSKQYPRISSIDFAICISEWYRRVFQFDTERRRHKLQFCEFIGIDRYRLDNRLKQISENVPEIKIYQTDTGHKFRFYSIMFQGGLPLNYIFNSNTPNAWKRLLAGLDNDQEVDESLVIASQSKELSSFCEAIANAYDNGNATDMPFNCTGDDYEFYLKTIEVIKGERRRNSRENPVSLKWSFDLDYPTQTITPKYSICATKVKSADSTWKSVQVFVDDEIKKTFTYNNRGQLISMPIFESKYLSGAVISCVATSAEGSRILIKEHLSFDTEPTILYGEYNATELFLKKGNHQCAYCLMPNNWSISDSENITADDKYILGNFTLIRLNKNATITVNHDELGRRTISANTETLETKIVYHEIYNRPFNEHIINNPTRQMFRVASSTGSRMLKENEIIRYRLYGTRNWGNEAPQGLIEAVIANSNGENITKPSFRFIHLDSIPYYECYNITDNSFNIRFNWANGTIKPDDSLNRKEIGDNTWTITEQDRNPIFVIQLNCTINGNTFPLKINAPFNRFAITYNNKPIRNNDTIPFDDINSYIIRGSNNIAISVNQGEWKTANAHKAYIPLTDILELAGIDVQQELEKTLLNIPRAKVSITFRNLDNLQYINFHIKKFPFKIDITEDNHIQIVDENNYIINDCDTELFPIHFYDPMINLEENSIKITNGRGSIQENVPSPSLLISKYKGSFLPKAYRAEDTNKNDYINRYYDRLNGEYLHGDNWDRIYYWWRKCSDGAIPPSSAWDMLLITKAPLLLWKFAFKLWADEKYDEEEIFYHLLKLEDDLYFQWYWLKPLEMSYVINPNNDMPTFEKAATKHCLGQNDQYNKLAELWTTFCNRLRGKSFSHEQEDNLDLIDNPTTQIECSNYNLIDLPNAVNISEFNNRDINGNIQQLIAEALANGIQNQTTLNFSDNLKRAIIYCHKYNLDSFIYDLTNKLRQIHN